MRDFKEESKWLDEFMALADRADAAMGDLLRSYAVTLLNEIVTYAINPLKLDGKPIQSDLEAGILVLSTIIDLVFSPYEKVIKDANEFSMKLQWRREVEEEMKNRIATADQEGVLNLIRWLSLRNLVEVKLKPSLPIPYAQSKMLKKNFLFTSPNGFKNSQNGRQTKLKKRRRAIKVKRRRRPQKLKKVKIDTINTEGQTLS